MRLSSAFSTSSICSRYSLLDATSLAPLHPCLSPASPSPSLEPTHKRNKQQEFLIHRLSLLSSPTAAAMRFFCTTKFRYPTNDKNTKTFPHSQCELVRVDRKQRKELWNNLRRGKESCSVESKRSSAVLLFLLESTCSAEKCFSTVCFFIVGCCACYSFLRSRPLLVDWSSLSQSFVSTFLLL
jgi:hypothetical protein